MDQREGSCPHISLEEVERIMKIFMSLILVLGCGLLYAAEVPKIFQLDVITVSGERLKEELKSPNAVFVSPEILLQGLSSNLDGALLRIPGVDVQRIQQIGGALDDESIRIRGLGSRRLGVLIDGRPLNTPGTAGGYFVDWTTVPLMNVEKIAVIKGYADPRFGNSFGVINLIQKKPREKAEIQAEAMKARYDTDKLSFFHSFKPSRLEYTIAGNYARSDGYLRNGDFEVKNLTIYLGHDIHSDGKIKGNLCYSWVKKGFIVNNRKSKDYDSPEYEIPLNPRYPASDGEIMYGGMGAYPEDGSYWKRERVNFDLGYEGRVKGGLLDLRFWKNYAEREAFNTRKALNRVFHKEWIDDKSYGAEGSYKLKIGNQEVTFGFDYTRFLDGGDRNLPDDFRSPFRNPNYVNSHVLGLYLMDEITIGKDLLITPGLRYTSYRGKAGPSGRAEGIKDISLNGISPSVKITYFLREESQLFFSLANAIRVPTPPEHYWHYSPDAGIYTGDMPMKKEEGLMVQGGLKAKLTPDTFVEFSPYYYNLKNFIRFDLINFISYNIDRVRLYGCEIEVSHQLGKGFSVFGNYSLQKSKIKGDPIIDRFVSEEDRSFDELPSLPEHVLNFGIQYKGKKEERVRLYGKYVSSQNVIYNNNMLFNENLRIRKQKEYLTLDLELKYPLGRGVELMGFLQNIFNEKYQERFGYEAMRRTWGIGLRGVF